MKLASHPSEHDSNDRFRVIVESSPNGIVVATEDSQITMVNAKAEELFGYSRDDFLKLTIEDLLPKSVKAGHREMRESYHSHPEVRSMGHGRDLYALRHDGTEFPVEIGLTPLFVDGKSAVFATIVDITERKKAEEKLTEFSEQLQFQAEILRNVHDAVFFLTKEGIVKDWNEGASRVFGLPSEQAIGNSFFDFCPDPGPAVFEDRIKPAIERDGLAEEVLRCQLQSGSRSEIFVRARVTKMAQGEESGYVFCVSDISDQKRLEVELVKVSENEQRKIGQDLHDDLCSQLSGIGCLTKVLEQQLHGKPGSEEATELAATISELVASAGLRAREIAKGLVPSVLENQGIGDALYDLAQQNRKLFGIQCGVHIAKSAQFDHINLNTRIQIYRIAQEAITNAARHSEADTISIRLSEENHRMKLMIEDDGKGMADDLVSSGMGLLTMKRRAELIQADFQIQGTPGHGTKVICSIPILQS